MAPGTQVRPLGEREYALRAPGMTRERRVTTDPDYYEDQAKNVELWSPGNPMFEPPHASGGSPDMNARVRLQDLLDDVAT